MQDKQKQNFKTSCGYQRKILKAYRKSHELEVTQRCNSENDKENQNNETESKDVYDLRCKLRLWALEHNISHTALRSLALILNKHTPNLVPVDPRVLMKTPRYIVTRVDEDSSSS